MLIAIVIRLHVWTQRSRLSGRVHVDEAMKSGRPIIIVYWHQDVPGSLIWKEKIFPKHPLAAMVSRSRDGDLIAGVLRRFGLVLVRASSSRGGARGLIELIRWVKSQGSGSPFVAYPLDGPHGPPRRAKPGAAMLARKVNAWIIPLTVRYSRFRELRSWDRTRIAGFFSRTDLYFGESFDASNLMDSDDRNAEMMESVLEKLHREADEKVMKPR